MADWLQSLNVNVVPWLALYGALLSTVGVALSIFNWRQAIRRDRRSLKLDFEEITGDYVIEAYGKLTATNVGHRVVTVNEMFLECRNGERITVTDHGIDDVPNRHSNFPVALTDGQTARVYYSFNSIAQFFFKKEISKLKLRPVCIDSTGKKWRGRWWKKDITDM
jgi:hypothetical protein